MLKKNTRKRLLAGALATVMMLTMCPSWALADDEEDELDEVLVPFVSHVLLVSVWEILDT